MDQRIATRAGKVRYDTPLLTSMRPMQFTDACEIHVQLEVQSRGSPTTAALIIARLRNLQS